MAAPFLAHVHELRENIRSVINIRNSLDVKPRHYDVGFETWGTVDLVEWKRAADSVGEGVYAGRGAMD
jgi:predicted fused transcriptional regulator/phosphomethylpyrimidine kinase